MLTKTIRLNHIESTLVVVAPQHVTTILKLAPRLPDMKCIISMDTLSEESRRIYESWGAEFGIKIYDLAQSEFAACQLAFHSPSCSRGDREDEPQAAGIPRAACARYHLLYFCECSADSVVVR